MSEELEKMAKENHKELADKTRKELALAVHSALVLLKENEREAMKKIKEQVAQKAKKLESYIKRSEEWSDVKLVRKYWGGVGINHFWGDDVKINGSNID